jgi:ribonuclease HI
VVTIYVDGAGGDSSGYGYYVQETGESEYVDKPGLTNNQAEYSAVLAALERFAGSAGQLTILSDSQVVVRQINHEYAINDPALRGMAQTVWRLLPSHGNARIQWIPRRENLAGKMLGS